MMKRKNEYYRGYFITGRKDEYIAVTPYGKFSPVFRSLREIKDEIDKQIELIKK